MSNLDARDSIELAIIWYEEFQSLSGFTEYMKVKFSHIMHKARHGDSAAKEFLRIHDTAFRTYLDNTGYAQEKPLHPLEEIKTKLETQALILLDGIRIKHMVNGDAEGFISLFLRLPRGARRWYLGEPHRRRLVRKIVGPELMEILEKDHVEIRVTLDVEEVIPLIIAYGRAWRYKLGKIAEKTVKTVIREVLKAKTRHGE